MSIIKTLSILIVWLQEMWWSLPPFSQTLSCACLNSAIFEWEGNRIGFEPASDPCLQPAGTCTANLRDLMLQNNSPAHLCWELEANQVGIANESFGTISVSDIQIYFWLFILMRSWNSPLHWISYVLIKYITYFDKHPQHFAFALWLSVHSKPSAYSGLGTSPCPFYLSSPLSLQRKLKEGHWVGSDVKGTFLEPCSANHCNSL